MSTTPVCQASTRPGPEATGRALCSDIRTDLGHPAPLLQGRQDTEGATQSASQHTTRPAHASVHTHATHAHTHMQTYASTHTRASALMHTPHTHVHTCTQTHVSAHTHRTPTHTNTHVHTCAHKHTCTNTRHGHGDTAAPSWRDMAAVPAMPWAGCISRPAHRVQPGGGWKPSPGKMEKEGTPPCHSPGKQRQFCPILPTTTERGPASPLAGKDPHSKLGSWSPEREGAGHAGCRVPTPEYRSEPHTPGRWVADGQVCDHENTETQTMEGECARAPSPRGPVWKAHGDVSQRTEMPNRVTAGTRGFRRHSAVITEAGGRLAVPFRQDRGGSEHPGSRSNA